MSSKRVLLFTSPSCSWCTTAKSYFKKEGIRFQEIDITKNKEAAKDCQKHGCRGVPVIAIGSEWICGFDKNRVSRALGLKVT